MYDYVTIHSDEVYIKKRSAEDIKSFLVDSLGFHEISSLRFSKEIRGEFIYATGILADSNCSYAFDTLEGIEEINLIEIDIPDKLTYEIEEEIINISKAIASKFSWIVDLRE